MNITINNKQPPCLPILFLTEMWERFGFYIVQILLIFYLTKVYHYSDTLSAAILGAFTGLSYITPVAGGYLADNLIGHKHAIIFGGLLLSAGYALLALQQDNIFYFSLAAIAIGTGFFKPNISSYLGNFYELNDSRCERGYTIFYIGINVGIVLATTSSGYILNYFGWKTNFIVASAGLILGVITFVAGLSYLEKNNRLIMLRDTTMDPPTKRTTFLIYAATLMAIYLFSLIIQNAALANVVFGVGAVGVLVALLTVSYRSGSASRGSMLSCLLLISLSTLFWAMYYQLFFSLNLFIDRVLDRNFFGHELPSPIFISLLPIFMITIGPFIGWAWQTLAQKKRNPSTVAKFTFSLLCMALGLFLLAIGTQYTAPSGLVNKQWVVSAYLLFALGELLISPICIAMVIEMVPPAYSGMMMGGYLAAIGFGAKLASILANVAAVPANMQDTASIVAIYHHAFLIDALFATVTAILILAATPVLKWLGAIKDQRSLDISLSYES